MKKQNIKMLSIQDIVKKTMQFKGLELSPRDKQKVYAQSKPIMEFDLTPDIIKSFEKAGFNFIPSKEVIEIGTFVFKFPNGNESFFAFKKNQKVVLTVGVVESHAHKEGVHMIPMMGNYIHENKDGYMPGLLAFRIATKYFEVHPIIKEIIERKTNTMLVKWSELGLEGIMNIYELWKEFEKEGPSRSYLTGFPFLDPNPNDCSPEFDNFTLPQFIPKEHQVKVLTAWKKQVAEFAKGL